MRKKFKEYEENLKTANGEYSKLMTNPKDEILLNFDNSISCTIFKNKMGIDTATYYMRVEKETLGSAKYQLNEDGSIDTDESDLFHSDKKAYME